MANSRSIKILQEEEYDALHDHQDILSGWHYLFAANLPPDVRIVHVHNPSYQIRNNYGVSFRRRCIQKLGRKLLKTHTSHILGTSKQILDEYGIKKKFYPRQQINSLHCAFDIERWQGDAAKVKQELLNEFKLHHDTKIVLFAGRFDNTLDEHHPQNHKNSVLALKIINNAISKNSKIKFLMAGINTAIRKEFIGLISELGLLDSVFLLGIRKDMEKLMLGSDVLLFPSRAEGLGMVAVEAQAAGLPVASTRTTGTVTKKVLFVGRLTFCNFNLISHYFSYFEQISIFQLDIDYKIY